MAKPGHSRQKWGGLGRTNVWLWGSRKEMMLCTGFEGRRLSDARVVPVLQRVHCGRC